MLCLWTITDSVNIYIGYIWMTLTLRTPPTTRILLLILTCNSWLDLNIMAGASCGAGNGQLFRSTWSHTPLGICNIQLALYFHTLLEMFFTNFVKYMSCDFWHTIWLLVGTLSDIMLDNKGSLCTRRCDKLDALHVFCSWSDNYDRTCSNYQEFQTRAKLLTTKLLKLGYRST